jgi:NAD(P)-dependent dehydrogenase (short-subunit alcohol dehydrogenase family)
MRFSGKSVLVTGGGSGIGLATALAFAREGARVAVADVSAERGREAAAAGRREGLEMRVLRGDVSRESDAAALVEATVEAFGRLDVLFNNAGILIEAPVHEMSEADWDRILAVNLKGSFLMAKHAVRAMLRQGGGAIVNTASVNALVGDPDEAAYCASKAGVALLTKSMALAYAKDHIRVNAVCPGWTETRMFQLEADNRGVTLQAYKDYAGKQHPNGRIGRPEEIASVVLFLASEDASFVTGALVVADGGYTAA